MVPPASHLLDHNIEAACARRFNIIRPLKLGDMLLLLQQLRINAKLAISIFAPDKYFRVLDEARLMPMLLLIHLFLVLVQGSYQVIMVILRSQRNCRMLSHMRIFA